MKADTFSVFQRTRNALCLCGNMTEISDAGVFRSDSVPVHFGDIGLGLNIILIKYPLKNKKVFNLTAYFLCQLMSKSP